MATAQPPASPGAGATVVIGGGFAGLAAARGLVHRGLPVVLVDRLNHHLFQPLLYQVAMAGLAPSDIALPIRAILRRARTATVLLDEVVGIDVEARRVTLARSPAPLEYRHLVVAAGAQTSYFGNDAWVERAPGLKDLDDALEVRRRVLLAFEDAERSTDPVRRRELLTFVVIGGGPTGVELAGAVAELARFVLARDFRQIKPEAARVILLEGGERVLPTFPPALSESARRQLETLGVQVVLGARVTAIDAGGVSIGAERIQAATVLWAAGVTPSPLGAWLGVARDASRRVPVGPDCSIAGHPEVFVVGDLAAYTDPRRGVLPGIAPVAMQQGTYVAEAIACDLAGRERPAFRYVDRGTMATIGRRRAVADLGRFTASGMPAWLAWLAVHLYFLIGFRNRLLVLGAWTWSYVTYKRGARLITGRRLDAGAGAALGAWKVER